MLILEDSLMSESGTTPAPRPDADLPGDARFHPVNGGIEYRTMPNGRVAMLELITISAEAQAAQHHNLLRYAELQKLRRGQSNHYNETSYR